MKAIHLVKFGESKQAFEIREIPKPAVKPGQVLIKVQASGINFADVMARRGLYHDAPPLPAVLGYDVAGIIEEIGEGIEDLKVGDVVTAMTRFGGYAEYVTTVADGVARIPKGWDAAKSTTLTTQVCTAIVCAEEVTHLYPGERILIQAAAGGVGRILIQYAKHKGCVVFATASTAKQDYLREIGVDYPIDYLTEDFSVRIPEILGDKKLDVVYDNLGGKRYKQGLKLLGPGGRIISYGAADQNKGSKSSKLNSIKVGLGFGFHSPIGLVQQSKAMIGVNMLRIADHKPHILKKALARAIDLCEQGIINPRLDKVFPAGQIADAHDYLESRQSMGKVVVEW